MHWYTIDDAATRLGMEGPAVTTMVRDLVTVTGCPVARDGNEIRLMRWQMALLLRARQLQRGGGYRSYKAALQEAARRAEVTVLVDRPSDMLTVVVGVQHAIDRLSGQLGPRPRARTGQKATAEAADDLERWLQELAALRLSPECLERNATPEERTVLGVVASLSDAATRLSAVARALRVHLPAHDTVQEPPARGEPAWSAVDVPPRLPTVLEALEVPRAVDPLPQSDPLPHLAVQVLGTAETSGTEVNHAYSTPGDWPLDSVQQPAGASDDDRAETTPVESTAVQEIQTYFTPAMGEAGGSNDETAIQAEPQASTAGEDRATPATTPVIVLVEPQAADEAPSRPDIVVVRPLALPSSDREVLALDYPRLQAMPECELTRAQLKAVVVDQFWQLASQGSPLTYYRQVPVLFSSLLLSLLPVQFQALHMRLDRLAARFPDDGLSAEPAERERQLDRFGDWTHDALADWQTTFRDLEPEIRAWRQALRQDLQMLQAADAGEKPGL